VVGQTLAQYIDPAGGQLKMPNEVTLNFRDINRVSIVACGTGFYAGLIARYWFERYAALPAEIEIASEFRYHSAPLGSGNLAVIVSRSGETADTLASLELAKVRGQRIFSVVNVPSSTIARGMRRAVYPCPTGCGKMNKTGSPASKYPVPKCKKQPRRAGRPFASMGGVYPGRLSAAAGILPASARNCRAHSAKMSAPSVNASSSATAMAQREAVGALLGAIDLRGNNARNCYNNRETVNSQMIVVRIISAPRPIEACPYQRMQCAT
jgi:SIS domain